MGNSLRGKGFGTELEIIQLTAEGKVVLAYKNMIVEWRVSGHGWKLICCLRESL